MNKSWSIWSSCQNELLKSFETEFVRPPVVMCLGSSRMTEDMLGPTIGSLLKKHGYQNEVFGTENSCITAQNLEIAQKFVKNFFPDQKLLVIDASTTTKNDHLGQIVLRSNYTPFNPSLKNTHLEADWFLFGVCSKHGVFPDFFCGKRLLCEKMARLVAGSLLAFSNKFKKTQSTKPSVLDKPSKTTCKATLLLK